MTPCSHDRESSACWLVLLLCLAGAGARAELVYANTNQFFPPATFLFTNAYSVTVPDGQGGSVVVPAGQVGDSIQLTQPGEFERFRFSYTAFRGPQGTLAGATLVLRFYENNGPAVAVPGEGMVRLPGDLLYQSNPFAVEEGLRVVTLTDLPGLWLPQDMTWSVEFVNLNLATSTFSMVAYGPPQVGTNPSYYLTLEPGNQWVVNPPVFHPTETSVLVPGNFPASLEVTPIPEPGVTTLAGLGTAAFLVHSRRRFRRRV
ncbi:MAG TPA: hypothetical protein PKE47_00115 [Verrucomicrobiota bacterium]|nr:hypothetical protein [Verrucomicrobiota bacterium]